VPVPAAPVHLEIVHPVDFGHVHDPDGSRTLPVILDAVPAGAKLTVQLHLPDGTVLAGKELDPDRHDLVAFHRHFEIANVPSEGTAYLSVTAAKGKEAARAGRRVQLQALRPWAFDMEKGHNSPTITLVNPGSCPATVNHSFTTYGNVDPTNATMQAAATDGVHAAIWGTPTTVQGFNWAFSFTLTANTTYTLNITASASGSEPSGKSCGITTT
jgi:hypothetical protein